MDRLVVSSTGFPLTNKTLRFFVDMINKPLTEIGKALGEYNIISGVELIENTEPPQYTPGYVIYNQEILPFVGGVVQESVSLIETVETVDYNTDINDDSVLDNLPAYITRHVRFGEPPEAISVFPFDRLTRLNSLSRSLNARNRGSIELVNHIDDTVSALEASEVTIPLQRPLEDSNYRVLLTPRIPDPSDLSKLDFKLAIKERTNTGFTVYVTPNGSNFVGVWLDWAVLSDVPEA